MGEKLWCVGISRGFRRVLAGKALNWEKRRRHILRGSKTVSEI